MYILSSCYFSFHTAWGSAYWKTFPSLLSFKTTLNGAIVYVQPIFIWHPYTSPSIHEPNSIFSLICHLEQYWVIWEYRPLHLKSLLVFSFLLMHSYVCTSPTTQLIVVGISLPYDLVGLTDPSSWWPTLGHMSLNFYWGQIARQDLYLNDIWISAAGDMALLLSIRNLHCDHPTGS